MSEPNNVMTVRQARPADANTISALAHQLLLLERSIHNGMGTLTPWAASTDEIRKQMLRSNTCFFVAESHSKIIGYVKVMIHGGVLTRQEVGLTRWMIDVFERTARRVINLLLRRPRPNVEASGGYIAGIFVRAEARRSNVGRSLVVAAEDWLRAQGVQTSELHVLHANVGALHFWEQEGYAPLTMGMQKKL